MARRRTETNTTVPVPESRSSQELSKFSLEDLKKELSFREQQQKMRIQSAQRERARVMEKTLDVAMVDALVPEHGRTTCSDENLSNGWHSNGYGVMPRCNRCALLQSIRESRWPEEFALQALIVRNPDV